MAGLTLEERFFDCDSASDDNQANEVRSRQLKLVYSCSIRRRLKDAKITFAVEELFKMDELSQKAAKICKDSEDFESNHTICLFFSFFFEIYLL